VKSSLNYVHVLISEFKQNDIEDISRPDDITDINALWMIILKHHSKLEDFNLIIGCSLIET
jgi:hypothetical protein